MGIQHLIIRFGLAAVFLGSCIEGDLSMVLGGVVSHRGYFPLPIAIAVAAMGAFIGDCIWYTIGRFHTSRFQNAGFYRRVGPRIEEIVRKVGVWEIVIARFVYGTKNASMLFWGLHGLPVHRFVPVDAIGCILSATFFVGLGYLVGDGAETLLGHFKRIEFLLLGAVAVAILVLLLIRALAQRRKAAEQRVE